MKKKTAIIVGTGVAAAAAVTGYLVYKNQQKKKAAQSSQSNNGNAFMSVSQGGGAAPSIDQIADAAQRQIQTVIPEVKQIVASTLPISNSTSGGAQVPVYTPSSPSFSPSNYSLASLRAMKWYGGPNKDVYVSDRIANYDPGTGMVMHTDATWKGKLVSDTQIDWTRIDGLKESWISKTQSISTASASTIAYRKPDEYDYSEGYFSGLAGRRLLKG